MSKPARKTQALPQFRSEAKAREFWESKDNDATQYFDPSTMVAATFKNLKPSTTSISLDVPSQSSMKVWLAEKLDEVARR